MPNSVKKTNVVLERDQVFDICLTGSKIGIADIEILFFSHENLRRQLQDAHFAIESFVQARNNNEVATARITGKKVLEGGAECSH